MRDKHIKFGYVLLGIFAVYFIFVAGKVFYAMYFSETSRFDHQEITLGEGPSLRYVAAGDSVAYGTGASGLENTFAYQVAEELAKNYEVHYINTAEVGAKTNDFLNNQLDAVVSYQPDLIVITITSNDVMRLRPNEITLENYKEILSGLTNDTNAQIYITGPVNFSGIELFPKLYQYLIEQRANRLNEDILSLEINPARVHILNVHDEWAAISGFGDKILAKDKLHSSDFGHALWRDMFLKEIGATF
jgi:lysophospholipase L1-like esterase